MIDAKLVRSKLESCRTHLRQLEPLARLPFATFNGDYVVHNAAERLIQLIVDSAVDVNNHLVLNAGRSAPKDYYSSFIALIQIGAVPAPLAKALARTTGLRNRLVHAYEQIDLKLLHRGLRTFVANYNRYIRAVRAYTKI